MNKHCDDQQVDPGLLGVLGTDPVVVLSVPDQPAKPLVQALGADPRPLGWVELANRKL